MDSVVAMFLPFGILLLVVWSTVWKGIALWHAAERKDKGWFIAMLILNTVGVLELIYLVFIVKFFRKNQ